jgi:hypothetical protein
LQAEQTRHVEVIITHDEPKYVVEAGTTKEPDPQKLAKTEKIIPAYVASVEIEQPASTLRSSLAVETTPEVFMTDTLPEVQIDAAEAVIEDTEELTDTLTGYFAEILDNEANWITTVDTTEGPVVALDEIRSRPEIFNTEELLATLKLLFEADATEEQQLSEPVVEHTLTIDIAENNSDADASFTPRLAEFIDTLETEVSEPARELLYTLVERLDVILARLEFAPENPQQSIELETEELQELTELCAELLQYLGFEATEQNARKLLIQLLKSEAAIGRSENNSYENLQLLEKSGTREYKFGSMVADWASPVAARAFSPLVIGYIALSFSW